MTMRLLQNWPLRTALSLVLLLLVGLHVDAVPIATAFAGADPYFLAAALLLVVPNIALQHAKWRLLLRGGAPMVPQSDVRASLFAGFTLGLITPARIGEFGGRAVLCRGAGKGLLVGLTAVDKASTMLVTVLVGVFSALSFGMVERILSVTQLVVVAALLITPVAAGVTVAVRGMPRWLDARIGTRGGAVVRRVALLAASIRALPASMLARLGLLSLLFYATFVVQFYFLLAAFGPLPSFETFSGIAAIMLVKTVIPPVTIGELGIREGVSVAVLSGFGVVAAAAFSASLLLFAINILLPALAGAWFLLRRTAGTPGAA